MAFDRKNLVYDLTRFGVYRLRVKATGEQLTAYVHDTKGAFFGNVWHEIKNFVIQREATFNETMDFFDYYEDWPKPILEGAPCKSSGSE